MQILNINQFFSISSLGGRLQEQDGEPDQKKDQKEDNQQKCSKCIQEIVHLCQEDQ